MTRSAPLALVLGLLAAAPAWAFHRQTATILQVTPVGSTIGSASWGGFRFVVFDSDGDLLGNGSTGRQAFLFDLQELDRGGPGLHQLTAGPLDARRPATGRRGRQVIFDGLPNGAGPRQLFLVDRGTGVLQQLTNGAADSRNARIDDTGRIAVFESEADFFATGVGGTQIYRLDVRRADPACPYPCIPYGNRGLTQVTNKAGTNRNAVTSRGGGTIAFESDADLLGVGETETQVYLREGAAVSLLTRGPGASRNPTLSRNGRQLALESDADLAGTGSTGTQVFVRRRLFSALEQVSAAPGGQSTRPSMSSGGRFMTFVSADDLLGNGSSGVEVFTFNVRRGRLSQVTNGAGTSALPAHSTGVFATFVSDADLLGNGTTGQALYLVNLFRLGGATLP
jgi:Tol biopolymer transport system component